MAPRKFSFFLTIFRQYEVGSSAKKEVLEQYIYIYIYICVCVCVCVRDITCLRMESHFFVNINELSRVCFHDSLC